MLQLRSGLQKYQKVISYYLNLRVNIGDNVTTLSYFLWLSMKKLRKAQEFSSLRTDL